jgi:hypothetical protein
MHSSLGAGETRLTEDFGLALPADLSLVKSIAPNTPPYGGTVTFTIEVSNAGPFAATGVSVRRRRALRDLPASLGITHERIVLAGKHHHLERTLAAGGRDR